MSQSARKPPEAGPEPRSEGEPDLGGFNAGLFEQSETVRVGPVELRQDDDLQRHREKLARIVLDEMYQFVALLDARGTLLEVNRAALEGGGIRLSQIQGRPFWEAHWWTVSREVQSELQRAIERAARGEFVRYDVEVYGGARGSETIIIDFSLFPVADNAGRVMFLLAEGRNITEKKRAEAEIARKNEELSRLLARVRELDELKSQFFANVSHELRTPLALILGPVERMLAEGGAQGERHRHDLEVIRRNATTLLKQVNDLLDVSKLDAGKMEIRHAEIDLAQLVRVIAAHFEALAPQRGIAYAVEVPGSLPAEVDPDKIERVALNLLSNAFKFVPAGGRVKVSLESTPEGRAVLSVQDSGPGVRPDQRRLIFERFRQGEGGADRQFGGTGLGLAIARDFVDLHGGTITVTDAPGGGALFLVEVPLRAPEGVPVRRRAAETQGGAALRGGDAVLQGTLEELRPVAAEPEIAAATDDGRPVVLVAEDNPEMRRFIAESLGDHAVLLAPDGEEALRAVTARRPDVLVTDLMMPVMSGDRLVAEIRARDELDGMPILILSARADDALRIRLLRSGAQDYVIKPFSAEELRTRVGNLIEIKRAREVLQAELDTRQYDLEVLARELTGRKRELATALDAARIARDDAERAAGARESFLALISHELRTPLTTIRLQVDLLRRLRGEISPREEAALGRLDGASGRLLELVDGVLEQARLSGRMKLTAEPIDVATLVAEAVEELRPRAERKGLELEVQVHGPAGLATDRRALRLIVLNLIDNAIKYTDAGRVLAALAPAPGGIRLEVADTGRGIAPEDQERIFEPFEQIDPVQRKHTPGVGLGLSIVKRLVEALGGSIELCSEVGVGSTFTVILPERAVALVRSPLEASA